MKKICLLICFVLCFFSACTNKNIITDDSSTKGTDTNIDIVKPDIEPEGITEPPDTDIPDIYIPNVTNNPYINQMEYPRLIGADKYYFLYRGYIDDKAVYYYCFYDLNGEIALEETTDEWVFDISMASDDIIDMSTGKGTGITLHTYYSVSRGCLSEEFQEVIATSDELIAYVSYTGHALEGRKIAVQNIFDKGVYYKEFEFEFDLYREPFPIKAGKFINEDFGLEVTYYAGEEANEVTQIFSLN